jgi:hypothetical protein
MIIYPLNLFTMVCLKTLSVVPSMASNDWTVVNNESEVFVP